MSNNEKNNILDDKIINDPRLLPLFEENSRLLLQFFILETENKKALEKKYDIIYGWCIRTSRKDISNKVYSSDFNDIHNTSNVKLSIVKLSVYNHPKTIICVVNDLMKGHSLKTCFANNSLENSDIAFDFSLSTEKLNNCVIRPIVFNETNTLITRYFYSKNSLNSPYKDVPSYSQIIYCLDKIGVFKKDDNSLLDDWEKGLQKSLSFLQNETNLPFLTSGSIRFGNIEFINSQCSNEFEIHNVWFKNLRKEVLINRIKENSSQEVEVFIEPNIHTISKKVLVNCFLTNGGQVILDKCKTVIHEKKETLKINFKCEEPIGQIAISIWIEDEKGFQIWYKHSVPLVREIYTDVGIISKSGIVKSNWLEEIKKNKQTTEKVAEIEKISKASYNSLSTGGYKLDPWVKSDYAFSEIVNRINPEKSDAFFFLRVGMQKIRSTEHYLLLNGLKK